jgi:uncharacterized protein
VAEQRFDPVRNRRFLVLLGICGLTAFVAVIVVTRKDSLATPFVSIRSDTVPTVPTVPVVPTAAVAQQTAGSTATSDAASNAAPVATIKKLSTTDGVAVGGKESALIDAALQQVGTTTGYDPAYVPLDYPGGDVDISTGVCSDVVVRSYRAVNADLQQLLHDDMRAHFSAYPTRWGLTKPDANIDHRRVPNLETFFRRHGGQLAVTNNGADYQPGDVVTWLIDDRPHTGIVTNKKVDDADRFLIVHNVGAGTQLEDVLFEWPIVGHYHWMPATPTT